MNSSYGKQDEDLDMYSSKSGTRPELPGISGLGGWLILIQISLFTLGYFTGCGDHGSSTMGRKSGHRPAAVYGSHKAAAVVWIH